MRLTDKQLDARFQPTTVSAPVVASSLPDNGESDRAVTHDSAGADTVVGWKKKFKGKTSGGAWIHTHPSVERAIVENHHGFTFDGVAYNSIDDALYPFAECFDAARDLVRRLAGPQRGPR